MVKNQTMIEKILLTMKNVNDVEKFIGIRWTRNEHGFLKGDVFDSRLGINAPTIMGFVPYSQRANDAKMRKEVTSNFQEWLKGFKEKLS